MAGLPATTRSFTAEVLATHPRLPARVMRLTTAHGEIVTPTFMPVATKSSNSGLTPDRFRAAGTQILLGGNTYHMLAAPGLDVVHALGGMHAMMRWPGPMLTDSGGYQVFSLLSRGGFGHLDDAGGHFRVEGTNRVVHLTPESSLEAQRLIGADIVMAFDECMLDAVDHATAARAVERTHRWLAEARELHARRPASVYGWPQAFFGIVQGAKHRDLREHSARFVASQDTDGIAIGGESVGYDMAATREILEWVVPLLPPAKPRYTMGLGLKPGNLLDAVAGGADLFDCVAPTRNARHGSLYHGRVVRDGDWLRFETELPGGTLNLARAEYARDARPILDGCGCATCATYSRAYLHALLKEGDGSFGPLGAQHNLYVMQAVCAAMRDLLLDLAGAADA